jgi:hypothetical protein
MKYSLHQETISYKEVMNSGEIFVVAGEDGTFFFCFDWYAPMEAKLWYKFSVNPFDIDFLKFKRIDYGFIDKNKCRHMCYKAIRYIYNEYNMKLLYNSFFKGGTITNIAKKLKVPSGRISRAKRKYTIEIKKWLERIFREYNFMDDSLEYINEYYNNWVILVNDLQPRKNRESLWKLIDENNIHSYSEFVNYIMEGILEYTQTNGKGINRSPNDHKIFKSIYKISPKDIFKRKYKIDIGVGYKASKLIKKE